TFPLWSCTSRSLQSCCCKKCRRRGATNPVKLVGSSRGSHIQKCGAPGTITVRTKNPACLSAVTNASDCECASTISSWLLLDSRVVALPRSSHLIVVTLSSLKPLFFNGLKKALPFSDNVGA